MLTKEYLDSDRINFLIWRYLLEGDYRETAAKFQKEWQRPAPHREFPWAPHVNSQALVQIIQRGLLYHALQREHLLIQVSKSGREALGAEVDALQRGIFGPLGAQDHQPRRHHHRHEQEEQQRQRQRQRQQPQQQQQQEPPQPQPQQQPTLIDAVDDEQADAEVKRPRLGNESENGTAEVAAAAAAESASIAAATAPAPAAAGGASPMDIDVDPISSSQSHNHSTETSQAYPFPHEEAQPTPPVPIPISVHTQGPDKSTQLDKVEELAANTTFLQLTPNPLSSPVSPLQTNGGSPPVILHCQWNPKDPSCLAGAGTDSMARIWTVAHTHAASSAIASSGPGPGPGLEPEAGNDQEPQQQGTGSHMVDGAVVTSAYCSLTMPETMATDSVVTAMAWNWDGSAIAVATDHNTTAAVTIWSSSGEPLNQVEFAEPPVIVLRWSPNSTALLTIAPDKGGAAVTIFSGDDLGQVSYVLPLYNLLAQTPLDASWINETDFLLCGGDTLLSLRVTPTQVELIHRFDTSGTDNFVRVLYDHRSKIAATTSDQGTLDLWDEHSRRRTIYAHAGEITAAQWQPLQSTGPEKVRLIATGGDDHMILIWNGRLPEAKPMCRLKMGGPVLALAFTPDGAFIAGATARQVLIWKVGDYFMPRASWTRPPQPGWLTPGASITAAQDNDVYTLGWDSTGQKLAYGGNNRLAVMRFR